VAYVDVTGEPSISRIYETDGIDWALKFVPAEAFSDAEQNIFQGPYLLATSGAGLSDSRANQSVMGTLRLFDLSRLPHDLSLLMRRRLNHSAASYAELLGLDPVEDNLRYRELRQLDTPTGLPLAGSTPIAAAIDPVRRLLYLANCTIGLTIVDLQDTRGTLDRNAPSGVDDRVLGSIPLLTADGRHACAADVAFDVSADGRTVAYVAAREDGLYLVDLGPARMDLSLEGIPRGSTFSGTNRVRIDEVRYFNEKESTFYEVALQLPGSLAEKYGDEVEVEITALDVHGDPVRPPTDENGDPLPNFARVMETVTLGRVPQTSRYHLNPDGGRTNKLIVSNLPLDEITQLRPECPGPNCTVIYGGIGGSLEMQALISEPLEGRVHEVPIEKVGVILLGIDGLRQDVFYPDDDVNDPENPPIRLDPATTPGFRDIMGGPFHNVDAHSLRLKGATAVFPSITLASWASVESGNPPKLTGQLGNEFFDRRLPSGVPRDRRPPRGMISYASGSFPGYDTYSLEETLQWDFVPAGDPPPLWAPQNRLWEETTLFKELKELSGYRQHFGEMVVEGAHYSRDSDRWLTGPRFEANLLGRWHLGREAGLADAADCQRGDDGGDCGRAVDRVMYRHLDRYLERHGSSFMSGATRFPGFLMLYQMGPDHTAHEQTAGATYRDFLRDFTGAEVLTNLQSRLISIEEYYNKMFVITTDHGHTASAADGEREAWAEENWQAGGPALDPSNHHMHLDEFVAVMGLIGLSLPQPREFNVLGPKPRDRNPDDRDVVVAFNGPMAHVYIRAVQADGTMLSWETPACQADRDAMGNGLAAALGGVRAAFGVSPDLYTDAADRRLLLKLIDAIDFILVRKGNTYVVRKAFAHSGPWPPDTEPAEPEPDRAECAGKTVPHSTVEEFSLEDWFAAHPNDFADAANRIRGLNHPERAGDLIIVFKFRTDDLRQDRYSSGGNLPSWHGSLNRSDSYVPFIVSYPGGNTNQIEDFVEPVCESTTHCPSTLKVAPLIKQIIREQLPMDSQEMEQGP
jgi:hypothetical protein